jgi:tetratricopeptide (TPR) repeat protein/peroxiredoxin
MPLEATLLKTKTGLDKFITEKYADEIAAILAGWSTAIRKSSPDLEAIEKALTSDFSGFSPQAAESRPVRSGPTLEVHQIKFQTTASLGRDAFIQEMRSALSPLSSIVTAEFQLVSIDAEPTQNPTHLRTRVHYELVGSGCGFHREQRVGEWEMEWATSRNAFDDPAKASDFRLRAWRALSETRSRSADPVFVDIASQVFADVPSYSAQLIHGVDYWRTTLDVASGIDIYGHNGVSVGDIDGDGFDDLYVCQPAGLPNRLYRNRGDGTFEDITEAAGVGVLENTACALFADVDNDGRQDLIVVCTSGPRLFLNQGDGKFVTKPGAFQFATPPQGTFTGAAIADYDRDGWLDIYFCLYLYYQGTDQYKYPSPYYEAENGPPNFMMRNQRDGTFHDVTAQSGLDKNNRRYSFCSGWNDYNRDGWPDLYVVNDFGRKNLYRNNGDGTFTDVAPQAGVEDVGAGMSVCWLDHDNDGLEDLYVANMWTAAGLRISTQEIFQKEAPEPARALYRKHAMGNSLFRNSASGVFEDKTASAGVAMGRWSWSSDAWDFDQDGFPDLYIANGMVSGESRVDLNSFFWRQVVANSPTEAKPSQDYERGWNALNELIRSDGTWSGFERNVFYANNRDGTFSDVAGAVGMDFVEDSRSFALTDFDHDGRLEVFLKNRNGPQLRVVKNVIKNLSPSISFRLKGGRSNRDAIGAVITVETDSGRQTRSLQAGSGFLSQHSKEVLFGLGEAQGPVGASIRWPSGLMQKLRDLPHNHRVWVEEGLEPSRIEAFTAFGSSLNRLSAREQSSEPLPTAVQTWLLAPVSAPDFSLPDVTGKLYTLKAFRGRPLLLNFWAIGSTACQENLKILDRVYQRWAAQGVQLLTINVDTAAGEPATPEPSPHGSFPILRGSDDVAGIYNILYRYLFDRHRDMGLPTCFLINEKGSIVRLYQGVIKPEQVELDIRNIPQTDAERLAKALPFPGISDGLTFRRNYLNYGSVYFQRGYYDQAEASFRLALGDDPGNAEALYGLGSVYLKQEKTVEARESFERATRLPPSYPDTLANSWNNLGLLATREERTAEAILYFQKALQLNPDHRVALDNLGNAYRQQKNWEEARKTLEHAAKINPEDPEANYSLGMVFAQLDDSDRAYEYLQKALKLRPDYPEALNNLGVLYLRTERRDQAVASFEECIRVAPEFDQAYLNLARLYALEGIPDKARTVLTELLKRHPDHALARQMVEGLSK